MRRNELLSIIIPVYNSQKYLDDCLKSVIYQSYQSIEIILVDDGSNDSSRDICKKYAQKDNRVRYYRKDNGGVSAARNYGLSKSTGSFITFVDSDDTLIADIYEVMMKKFDDDVDVVCCGVNRIGLDGNLLEVQNIASSIITLTPASAMVECIKNGKVGFNVYSKIFRRSLFESKPQIRFPEGKLMEEAFVLPHIFKRCKKIVHIGQAKYNYFVREGSYTTKLLSSECYAIYDTIDNYEKNLKSWFPDISMKEVELWRIKNCLALYRRSIKEKRYINLDVFTRIQSEYKKIVFRAILSPNVSLLDKFKVIETSTGLYGLRKKAQY